MKRIVYEFTAIVSQSNLKELEKTFNESIVKDKYFDCYIRNDIHNNEWKVTLKTTDKEIFNNALKIVE